MSTQTTPDTQTDSASITIDAPLLEAYLGHIAPVADEFKLNTSAEGLSTRVVDPANVLLAELNLPSDRYEGDFGDGTLGLNRGRFDDVVGFADDTVTISLDQETRKLSIDADGLNYTLGLIDPSSIRQEPDLPDLGEQWTAEVVIEAGRLKKAVMAGDFVSDHVTFGADPDTREFVVSADGDVDTVRWAFGDDDLIDAQVDASAESMFSLDYLKDVVKSYNAQAEVRIRLGQELPVSMSAETTCGPVEYLLAPRISGDN